MQSSNFAAEYGTGGMNVSGVTKSGTLEVPRPAVRLLARPAGSPPTIDRTASPARQKPKSKYQYPGGNIGGPIVFGDSYTKNRDRLFFFAAFEAQRQQVDSGSHFTRTFSQAMRNGDFSELLANRGSNLNSIPQLRIPQGLPERGPAGAEQRHAAVRDADRQVPRQPVSAAELQRSGQPVQLRLQPARTDEPHRLQGRGSTGTSATARRPTSGSRAKARRPRTRAACGGRRPTSWRCRRRTSARTAAGRSPATSSRC